MASQKTADSKIGSKIDIDSDAIRELAALMEETGLTEIEVGEGERRLRVGKHSGGVSIMPGHAPAHIATTAAPENAVPANHPGTVTSPMVGTAYLRPDPASPPFVNAGDMVAVGDTLLIIEAMKVMNPIKAPKAGKVVRIIVSDAQPVEFGEALLIVE